MSIYITVYNLVDLLQTMYCIECSCIHHNWNLLRLFSSYFFGENMVYYSAFFLEPPFSLDLSGVWRGFELTITSLLMITDNGYRFHYSKGKYCCPVISLVTCRHAIPVYIEAVGLSLVRTMLLHVFSCNVLGIGVWTGRKLWTAFWGWCIRNSYAWGRFLSHMTIHCQLWVLPWQVSFHSCWRALVRYLEQS